MHMNINKKNYIIKLNNHYKVIKAKTFSKCKRVSLIK